MIIHLDMYYITLTEINDTSGNEELNIEVKKGNLTMKRNNTQYDKDVKVNLIKDS